MAQPEARWEAVGLTEEEYGRITELLGRAPNDLELGLYGAMWSEHCSYKSSRLHLRRLPGKGPGVLLGPGENAGVVELGGGWALAHRIESHNHPSSIEPYQGAATGVGGILRDIFTIGARPVALLDSLHFGPLDEPRSRYLFQGVVSGIAGYGNAVGVPTVGGETVFAPGYRGNPIINVMCLGLIRTDKIVRGRAEGAGNPVYVVGARTGRDGIHGASLLASRQFDEEAQNLRPAVQVGDPFMEKLLIEACLELMQSDAVVGVNDLGAAGITSAASETASRAGSGLDLDVARVPRREEGMTPYEVMLSESQERMLVIARAGSEAEVEQVFRKWGLEAACIGRVTDDGMLRVRENGAVVAEVPARTLTEEAPLYDRPYRFEDPDLASPEQLAALPEPSGRDGFEQALETLLGSPNLASKRWVFEQYDHMVQTNSVIVPGAGDAAVLRVRGTSLGFAAVTDANPRYCAADPYTGTMLAVAEAARNLVCTGAEPIALTNCLNFGNPERPAVMGQFVRAVDGLAEAARALGTPVTGGNVSFYNETMGENIDPTPVIGMVGKLDPVAARCTPGWKQEGDAILLLGGLPDRLGAAEYLEICHGIRLAPPPELDLELEKRVQRLCLEGIRSGRIRSAHDLSDGGLAVALAECCFAAAEAAGPGDAAVGGAAGGGGSSRTATGARIRIPLDAGVRADAVLFGEAASRILITIDPGGLSEWMQQAAAAGVPCHDLGRTGGDRLEIRIGGRLLIDRPVSALRAVWEEGIPCRLH